MPVKFPQIQFVLEKGNVGDTGYTELTGKVAVLVGVDFVDI